MDNESSSVELPADLWLEEMDNVDERSFDKSSCPRQQPQRDDDMLLVSLDEFDFSEEIPIPSDRTEALVVRSVTEAPEQTTVSTSPAVAASATNQHHNHHHHHHRHQDDDGDNVANGKHHPDGHDVDDDNVENRDSAVPFDRAVYESCSIALGVPCYRNPVNGPCSDRTDVACHRLAEHFPQVWEFIRNQPVALFYYVPLDGYDFHCGHRVTRDDCQPRVMRAERNGNDGLIGSLRVSDERIVADLFGPAVLYQRRIVVSTYERDTIPNHQFLYIVRMPKPKINDRFS